MEIFFLARLLWQMFDNTVVIAICVVERKVQLVPQGQKLYAGLDLPFLLIRIGLPQEINILQLTDVEGLVFEVNKQ